MRESLEKVNLDGFLGVGTSWEREGSGGNGKRVMVVLTLIAICDSVFVGSPDANLHH